MGRDAPLAIILRGKWIILATVVVFVAVTAVLSQTLEKVYATESTLLVSVPASDQAFDTVQASQALVRSYGDVIESPNIAGLVAQRVGGGATSESISGATTFEPVAETQLLKISAEDPDPARAKLIADSYGAVFSEYAERNLSQTTRGNISLADAAPLPKQPVRPQPTLYVIAAALLGLGLGVGLVFFRERLDRRLRDFDDVEARFETPVLARVPPRGRSEVSTQAFEEAFRILRTNLQFATGDEQIRSVAMVSAREGEGKTTATAQLARAAAEFGHRVVAVEADFRRPALAERLTLENPDRVRSGLSSYLAGAVGSLDDVVYNTTWPPISIVPAGPPPPKPSTVLNSPRGPTTMEGLLAESELVVVDCPPLNVGADASIVSRWVDGAILVVDLETSTEATVRDALRQLEQVRASVLGLLLNRDGSLEIESYSYYAAEITDRASAKKRDGTDLPADDRPADDRAADDRPADDRPADDRPDRDRVADSGT